MFVFVFLKLLELLCPSLFHNDPSTKQLEDVKGSSTFKKYDDVQE